MNQAIPILPCGNADILIEFYKHLGFELVGKFVRSYLIMKREEIELHFYGTKQVPPEANSSMCIIRSDDLDGLYEAFANGLKKGTGTIPRNGLPKITKIRDLSDDRRFTLTDPSGNTFYILTPKQAKSGTFFRDLDNTQYAEKFAVLYDLVYSKEDCNTAAKLLPKLLAIKHHLADLDRAKLLLVELDIQSGLGNTTGTDEVCSLIVQNQGHDYWTQIQDKLNSIFNIVGDI